MMVTKQKMALYKATAQRRWKEEQQQLSYRFRHTVMLAHKAAKLLKEQFGVRRVALFGSAASEELFHHHSDLDIAVWGLDESEYYRAVAQLLALDPFVSIDLIRVEDANSSLREEIEKGGVLL
jgi:predicted nucleotidyltransferase